MKRALSVFAAVIALMFGMKQPAMAVGFPTASYTWMNCAVGEEPTSGELSTVYGWSQNTSTWSGRVSGGITPCHPAHGHESLAIAVYKTDGTASGAMHQYPGGVANPDGFHFPDTFPTNTAAVCLLTGPTSRLDCLAINWTQLQNGSVTPSVGGHISTDAPVVSITPSINYTIPPGQDPTCPSCWG